MEWIHLNSEEKLEEVIIASKQKPVLLFKHSTSCSISNTALNRLERNWKGAEVGETKAYYLDLLSFRNLSKQVAEKFNVVHESPQVLIIENGKSVYNRSHFDIDYSSIKGQLEKVRQG
jgi:bacillithiol system protein YtxJ